MKPEHPFTTVAVGQTNLPICAIVLAWRKQWLYSLLVTFTQRGRGNAARIKNAPEAVAEVQTAVARPLVDNPQTLTPLPVLLL